MSYYFKDVDLNPIIERASDNDLLPLVEIMKKKISNSIDTDERYLKAPTSPSQYPDLIADEIRLFGGNSFANIFRGEGVSYKEVVCDVASKLKVNYNKSSSVERIEQEIIQKVFADAWDKMPESEKKTVLDEIGVNNLPVGSSSAMVLQTLVKMGGFKSYQIAVIVANAVSKCILGHGLSFVANQTLTKTLSIMAGPIGWVLSGIWMAIDIAGPSYRTTIPCVIHVAMLRQKQKNGIR